MSIIDVRLVRGRDGVWRGKSSDAEPLVDAVSCCSDCIYEADDAYCVHPLGRADANTWPDWRGVPEWCPLRRGPTVVMLAE